MTAPEYESGVITPEIDESLLVQADLDIAQKICGLSLSQGASMELAAAIESTELQPYARIADTITKVKRLSRSL